MEVLNKVFGLKEDARSHATDLINAYTTLAKNETGKKLANLLKQDGHYYVNLNDGSKIVKKEVKLKLIIKPKIPGQFLSPFEQDMNIKKCLESEKPLPTIIMWDPTLHFQYYKPRTEDDAKKVENDLSRRGTIETMKPWVVLDHELGYFKDFLERPMEYHDNLKSPAEIEKWNLEREKKLVREGLGKQPRTFYQDFVGGENENLALS